MNTYTFPTDDIPNGYYFFVHPDKDLEIVYLNDGRFISSMDERGYFTTDMDSLSGYLL